jgi:hypothetical protein
VEHGVDFIGMIVPEKATVNSPNKIDRRIISSELRIRATNKHPVAHRRARVGARSVAPPTTLFSSRVPFRKPLAVELKCESAQLAEADGARLRNDRDGKGTG